MVCFSQINRTSSIHDISAGFYVKIWLLCHTIFTGFYVLSIALKLVLVAVGLFGNAKHSERETRTSNYC